MKLYGVYSPRGRLKTVCFSSWDAKVFIFDSHSREFQSRYWHKATPAWRAAKKEGWLIEDGQFVPKKEAME